MTLTGSSVVEERCTAVGEDIRCSPAVVGTLHLRGCSLGLGSTTWLRSYVIVVCQARCLRRLCANADRFLSWQEVLIYVCSKLDMRLWLGRQGSIA